MGRVSPFYRLAWKFPLAAVAMTAALAVSTSRIDFQDVADEPHAVQNGARWTAFIPGKPSRSAHTATFRFTDAGPVVGGLLPGAVDAQIVTGTVANEPFDATVQRVNRAAKGDFLSSRPPRAEIERKVPTSGTIWDLKDIFSSYEGSELPKVALAPAGSSRFEDVMLAHNSFIRRDGLTETANIMMAKVKPRLVPGIPVEQSFAEVTVVAYAPATANLDTPFNALIGDETNQVLAPALMPRRRPGDINLANFLTGHGPQRRRPGDHKWAANALPANATKESQQACLARGIYFEARGEPARGQAAVGQVILNRVKNPAYPSTICGVVYQNKKWRNRCQFSFACDGIRDKIRSSALYKKAKYVAREVTAGNIWLPDVGDSTHYHADYVKPRWARKLKKTDRQSAVWIDGSQPDEKADAHCQQHDREREAG